MTLILSGSIISNMKPLLQNVIALLEVYGAVIYIVKLTGSRLFPDQFETVNRKYKEKIRHKQFTAWNVPKVSLLGAASCRQKHTLPDLPYGYKALEPSVSGEIMTIHHQKHHATYINNLNAAEEKLAAAVEKNDISQIIALQPALKFNGGGHINHSIFWEVLSPNGGGVPTGSLLDSIKADFGSFDNLKSQLSQAAVGVQGSGWAWLGLNPTSGRLRVTTCANQDPLQPTTGLVPLFGIDVWEHAYYLQYKNVRPDYVKAMFDIANWEKVAKTLAEARPK